MPLGHFRFSFLVLCGLLAVSCRERYESELPASNELGSPRGYRIARVITHYHSPYSYDACDKKGIKDGKLDAECLENLRTALCRNRVDLLFLTDHPSHGAAYGIKELTLADGRDRVLEKNGKAYGAAFGGCDTGLSPIVLPGFESRLMALGMESHLSEDATARENLYGDETAELVGRLRNEAGALVAIPHTESRSFEKIRELTPDAIEIYNIHANLDPKIRKHDLGAPPFESLPNILTYLIDPYRGLNPDFMFVGFFKLFGVYAKRWDELIGAGVRVTGIGGSDSHENVFPQKVSDGERLDAHRRLTRFMSNHVLVTAVDGDSVKAGLRAGRSWLVFEGFGTPTGMDLRAAVGANTVGVGQSVSLGASSAKITVALPSLHDRSPRSGDSPQIHIDLRKVEAGGTDRAVASTDDEELSYTTSEPGAYRAEISIRPRQLKGFLGVFDDYAEDRFPWIVTNHVYLDP